MNPNIISHRLFVEALTHSKPSAKPPSAGRGGESRDAEKSAAARPAGEPLVARAARHLAEWPSFGGDWEHSVS